MFLKTTRWAPRPNQILILDNRDSFTFNLAHRFYEIGAECGVARSDELTLDDLEALQPTAIVVSPGPGHPQDAGISVEAIHAWHKRVPILGVCLGHQAIGIAFGGRVSRDNQPCHGRASQIVHDQTGLFAGIASPCDFGRYHSLAIERPLPAVLREVASVDGLVMAVEHIEHPTFGVQFHPESVLSPDGLKLLSNFLNRIESRP